MHWMKKTTNAISDTGGKELVQVALLQTHGEDGASLLVLLGCLIGVSSVHFWQMCSARYTSFSKISQTPQLAGDRWNLSVPTRPSALLQSPTSFELRITISQIFLEAIVNSLKTLCDTSLSCIMGDQVLPLCFSFTMTIAMRSHLLDDIVRDWENIQLPSVNTSAGFTTSRDVHKCNKLFLDANKEGILSIAPLELLRKTLTTLQCTCHESLLSNRHWMGCRRCFAAKRLEALVDEDDSRSSSRVRGHLSFRLVSQLHVAIQTLWSHCLFLHVVWTNW